MTSIVLDEGECDICLTESSILSCDRLYRVEDINSHYFCFLFSSGLGQRGEEGEGVKGEEILNVIGECLNTSSGAASVNLNASQAKLDSILMPPPTLTPNRNNPRLSATPVPSETGRKQRSHVDHRADNFQR